MPKLKTYICDVNTQGLPNFSILPKLESINLYQRIKADGFEGMQGGEPDELKKIGLGCASSGRINTPDEAYRLAEEHQALGFEHSTLHVGWGIETDQESDALVRAILDASKQTGYPLSIETHRSTITQDIRRTVDLIERNPEMKINGDFSHYYTGLELPNGDFEQKLNFMQPIFDRVVFMQGRIGSSGNIQVDIGDGSASYPQKTGFCDFLEHHKEMWVRAMAGFLNNAGEEDELIFSPELLGPWPYYARCFVNHKGEVLEEGDRYQQALLYKEIARDCFEKAKERVSKN